MLRFILLVVVSFAVAAAREFIYNNGVKVYGKTIEISCFREDCCETVLAHIKEDGIRTGEYVSISTSRGVVKSTTTCKFFVPEKEKEE